jgi:hypothetical protein
MSSKKEQKHDDKKHCKHDDKKDCKQDGSTSINRSQNRNTRMIIVYQKIIMTKNDCKDKECKHSVELAKECICVEFSIPHGHTQTVYTSLRI